MGADKKLNGGGMGSFDFLGNWVKQSRNKKSSFVIGSYSL
jgi:hypothetical protein